MQKVIVIGSPGSGKSTFARRLNARLGLPLYYLDCLFWNEDGTSVEKDVFDARLAEVLSKERFIIDGNYKRTLELRLSVCDKVFFLDYPVEVCVEGIRSRIGTKRVDLPWVEQKLDEDFLKYVQNFHIEQVPKIRAALEAHPKLDVTVFHSREEALNYLNTL